MNLEAERVNVWAAPIQDRPGALATLLKTLQKAGADLQFLIARRSAEKPGNGVVFVTPLDGDQQIRAASQAGFNVTQSLYSIRVMGEDKAGIVAQVAQALADGGINLRGLSASVMGRQFIAYIGVDTREDADKALDILSRV